MIDETDAWCRQLGNFTPIVYRPAMLPEAANHAARDIFGAGERAAHAGVRSATQRGGAAAQFFLVASIMVAMSWPLSGSAQMGGGMGGRSGGHGNRGNHSAPVSPKNSEATAASAPNPLRAMLTEMQKLRADLLLTSQQIGSWSAMEDALRECIELNRSRMPVVQAGTPVDAQSYVQDLADNQRSLAEAEARFAAATKTAFAALNPRQLQTSKDRLAAAIADGQLATAAAP